MSYHLFTPAALNLGAATPRGGVVFRVVARG